MADEDIQDNAAKARIINHMNADHHDSIIRYLQHFHHVSQWQAYGAQMSEIDLNGMTFVKGTTGRYRVPFNPPLSSYREARERTIALDKEASAALGTSDISISEFAPPTGMWSIEFAIIAATFLGYSQQWWFAPRGPVAKVAGEGFARFSWVIQPFLLCFMVVVHGLETAYLMRYKLPRHMVNPRTRVFWLWAATTFIEGMLAYARFDMLVRKKREEKEKRKH